MKFSILFPVHNPGKKLTHKMKFKHFWMQKDTNFGNTMILCHFGPEKCQKSYQKDTNFRNTMILPHFGPEKRQTSYPERHKFRERHNSLLPWAENCQIQHKRHKFCTKLHSLTPSKNANKIRKVCFSRILHLI